MLATGPASHVPSRTQLPTPESQIVTSILGPRVVMFTLGFAVPMLAIVATLTLTHTLTNPGLPALWAWALYIGVSVVFGALAAVGFTYDLVREAVADERGLTIMTANRRARYEWDDVEPRARVFPRQVRFKAHDGTVFFLTTGMIEKINSLPFGPKWTPSGLGRW